MPLVDSSSVSVSKSPATTAADPSIDIVPSVPAMHTRRTLESMPPEILDRIVSFVSGNDILQLCHAVRYFKYISRAMFDFASLLKMDFDQRVEMFSFWPRLMLDGLPIPVPVSHLHVLQTYSSILPKHGGYASIDDSTGIELIISALPENVEVMHKDV
ncbi:hypothetical protein BJ741DRAFT_672973 [Chytriomyces cf. hyalinus JEL632]|nr:hypothetical protein BJ741DRAFT_672973 [Chytriomyces cf. hyalinus JEL632]